ncbi:MAG: M24 family metallopeptidase [Phycisphaerales bacterium]
MVRPSSRSARKPAAADHAHRLRCLRALAAANGTPALLVTAPHDVAYLTGFHGGDSYLVVPASGKPTIISDFRYVEELEPVRALARVVVRTGGMAEAVGKVLADARLRRVGLQAEHATLSLLAGLTKGSPGVKFVATTGLVAQLRAEKDAHEIALIRAAIRIEEAALEATLPRIDTALRKKGSISELCIAAILESEMKTRGSSTPGFETIIAAKANGSLPHYRPHEVKHTRNSPLLIDWGAVYNGYHGDQTRVLCWGKWPAKVREIYTVVRDAYLLAAAALAPGKTTREIDAIARNHIARAGYGKQFGHGLGHGIGLDAHEDPRVTHMAAPTTLEPGHIVTIEPGIYLPGIGGVRIEDDFLITKTGHENLCSLPTTLEWATR